MNNSVLNSNNMWLFRLHKKLITIAIAALTICLVQLLRDYQT